MLAGDNVGLNNDSQCLDMLWSLAMVVRAVMVMKAKILRILVEMWWKRDEEGEKHVGFCMYFLCRSFCGLWWRMKYDVGETGIREE